MWRPLLAGLVIALVVSCGGIVGAERGDNVAQMREEMIWTSARIKAKVGIGSGTVIYSPIRANKAAAYILTNYHVVRPNISLKFFETPSGEWVRTEVRTNVKVELFAPSELGEGYRIETHSAKILRYDQYRDLAILLIEDMDAPWPYVARLADEDEIPEVFERTFAVGAGLGMIPYPTEGVVSIARSILGHLPYISSSAPIIFGNSGGGLYTWDVDHYELTGVPSMMKVIGYGVPVPHLNYSIPMDGVAYFLRSQQLGYIL